MFNFNKALIYTRIALLIATAFVCTAPAAWAASCINPYGDCAYTDTDVANAVAALTLTPIDHSECQQHLAGIKRLDGLPNNPETNPSTCAYRKAQKLCGGRSATDQDPIANRCLNRYISMYLIAHPITD
jgi:hypothetical protein